MQWKGIQVGFFALASVVAAGGCGGTVSEGGSASKGGSAATELANTVSTRCHAACVKMAPCNSGSSCDCGCACPAGGTGCQCGPCTCGTPSPASCDSDCTTSMQGIATEHPSCAQLAITALDCVGQSSCDANGDVACRAERDAVDACTRHDSSPPPVPGTVQCRLGFAGGAVAAFDGGVGPSPCQIGWDGCSDGKRYEIDCSPLTNGHFDCTCRVNAVTTGGFERAAECSSITMDEANQACGFLIGP